ncbi:MAG: hypothetical protein QG652_393 [Pseudomonadota bacterium]|nr:hypothetical protein [Pseudomonadota bacterium]
MKCIRFPAAIPAVFFLAMGFTASAQAEVDVIAKAAIGSKTTELVILGRDFSPNFLTLDLSLTGAMGNFFVTFNNEFSIKDDIASYNDPNDSSLDGLIFYSRQDTNITFGHSFEIATVFIGMRTGKTDAHYTANSSSFGTTSDGYYIGASKSYYYKDKGALSGSIAIASLDGEVALSEPFVDTSAFVVGSTPPATIKGSALGLSLGIGWSGQIYGNTNYNIDLKLNQFDFEDDVVFGGLDLSYTENFSTLYLGITHFF